MEHFAASIASKIVEEPVALIRRQLSYLIYYDSNIESLKDALKKLDDKKNDVQRSVDAAKRNGATIKDQVQSWLENVSKIFREAQELETKVNMQRRCLYGLCPSLKSRYCLSKKAKKIDDKCVLDLKLDEGLSNNVANPPPLEELGSIISGFKGFESRNAVMNDVLIALRNEKSRIIGICGMGGVGKTTMVREIINILKGTNQLFDDVVMATVTSTVNIKAIQTEIAESLDMKIDKESESKRAQMLHERIKKSKRIMIILDDVWGAEVTSELKFEAIGIPFGVHEGCKILLTSRNEEVCKAMGCKFKDDIFRVQALNKEEAWELFRVTVGESLDNNNPDLLHVANLIADECKGLPIAIITIGKTLSNIDKNEWDAVLYQLKHSQPEIIPGMEQSVYSCIKLSYDKLDSDEVKSCFLLCCLFPEDYDVPIEYLVRYGLGRAIFENINMIENARKRVQFVVGQLKRRFLLLDSEKKECIKMHDIVRDVAISIASKDPHGFMVRSFDAEGWRVQKATNQEHCSAISLIDVKLDEDIKDGLECPKLELLQLKNSSSSEYSNHFKRLKELKVLAFLGMDMSSYLASKRSLVLGEPKYLHTLCLEDCKLGDISHVIGGLENLEILSFARSKIDKLPIEIGLLHRLRMLDATNCKGLEEIPHGVLSKLRKLEELYMAESFLNWVQTVGSKDKTSMASLDEVMSLSIHLKVLAIKIPDGQMLPNGFLLNNPRIRFHVSINNRRKQSDNIGWNPFSAYTYNARMPGYLFEKSLMLYGDVTKCMEIGPVRHLLKQSENLSLEDTCSLKYVIEELDDQGHFQHLKVLSIRYDKDIEYLMNGTDWTRRHQPAFPILNSAIFQNVNKLKVVCPGKLSHKDSLKNLRFIAIYRCHELKYVFSLSVAQNLVQLQTLIVQDCDKVEEIISKERIEDDNASHMITFQITVLKLQKLPKLLGFYKGNQRDSTYEVIKPNDESVNASNLDQTKETRNDQQHDQVVGSSSKSKVAQVGSSGNALFPSNCISWLPNLEKLIVVEVDSWNKEPVINALFDLEGHVSAFSQLQTLQVKYVGKVEHLWKNVQPGFQGFQNVRSLTIECCHSLKYLCPYEIYKLLVNLQEVLIGECRNMETIVLAAASTEDNIHEEGKETSSSGGMTLFPKQLINSFKLSELPNLESFCPDAYYFAWSSSTRTMHVILCPKLKTLGFAPLSKKMPAAVAENLSDDHVRGREESSTGSESGFGCAPLVCLQSRPSTHKFTQILPRPVNGEVTPTNLQTSSARDDLEYLEVDRSNLLEVIFLVQETPSTQAFDKLRELKLGTLRMLSHIWEKGLQVISGFGNLRLLQVRGCSELRYLFSPHIAKLLTCLETIDIQYCCAMEKIVGEAEGEGESIEDELTFLQVNCIRLENLPKLESFCSEAYTLNWQGLEVEVKECPKLKRFPPRSLYETSTWREKKNIIRSQEVGDKTT